MKIFGGLRSNIWKYFIYILTSRRAYIPLIGIYFVSFPENSIAQLGIIGGASALVSLLLQMPTGYLADKIGYKRTMIIAKIFHASATMMYILGHSFPFFMAGSVLLATAFALENGTSAAFLHTTLEDLHEEEKYTKLSSRISGNASLIQGFMIIALPFLTKINFILPFQIAFVLDIIGIGIAISLVSTKKHIDREEEKISVLGTLKLLKQLNFYPIVLFIALLFGIMSGDTNFRTPYLQSLGYPVIYIGLIMGCSRFIWFLVGRVAHKIEERFSIRQLFSFEIFFFSIGFLLTAILNNPFVVGGLISILLGYYRGRKQIITRYILGLLPNKKYKATILSFEAQISNIITVLVVLPLGYIMSYSYKAGYICLSILVFISLGIAFQFIKKRK